jgi:hypothetical protein
MAKRNLLHLSLPSAERRLARMRAAQLGITATEYVRQLIRIDTEQAGLLDLVLDQPEKKGGRHGS